MQQIRSICTALALFAGLAGPITQTALAENAQTSDAVTLINAFEVRAKDVDATIAAWKKARDFLQTQPGYIDTKLHRAIMPKAKFQLINIAKWESPAAFKAAISNFHKSPDATKFRGVIFYPALYVPVEQEAGS
ncbi:antibiotic biosynthesis monooxygenase family protein [Roseibium sp.]|uniref:antibiotic biosynthesis monooxygenase family protein n=1 Tax=Roseibium sp. TaxID=1936156 RepID=UPI003B52C36A